jgi:hypothetical protein
MRENRGCEDPHFEHTRDAADEAEAHEATEDP